MNFTKTVATLAFLAGAVTLASCSVSELNALTRTLDANVTAINDFDNAEEETETLSMTSVEGVVMIHPLSLQATGETLTTSEKVDLIQSLRRSVMTKQSSINEAKPLIREDIVALKADVAQFRSLGLTLTDEEKATITALANELSDIKVELKATKGLVYKKIVELRGHYQLENIDLILDTYQTADDAMTVRLEGVTRIGEMIDEAAAIVAARIG